MKVAALPRDANPYQDLLHAELRLQGVEMSYLDGPTGSQTFNLLVRPASLVWRRLRGTQVLHIHWVYDFVPHWARSRPWGRRLAQAWFNGCLWVAHRVRLRISGPRTTFPPHEQIFADDLAARTDPGPESVGGVGSLGRHRRGHFGSSVPVVSASDLRARIPSDSRDLPSRPRRRESAWRCRPIR